MKCKNNGNAYIEFSRMKSLRFTPIERIEHSKVRPYYRRYLEIIFDNEKKMYIPFKNVDEKNLIVKVEN